MSSYGLVALALHWSHDPPTLLPLFSIGVRGQWEDRGQVRLKLPYPVDPAHPLSGPAITGISCCWDQTLDVLEGWLVTSSEAVRRCVARISRSPLTGPRTGYRNRAHTHPKS